MGAKIKKERKKRLTKKVMELILELSRKYGTPKYSFGSFSPEDMQQEIFLLCCNIYNKFDKNRGELRNFLETSLRNRLKNFKRDLYFNPIPPCIYNKCKNFKKRDIIRCDKICIYYNKYITKIRTKLNIINSIPYTDDIHNKLSNVSFIKNIHQQYEDTRYEDLIRVIKQKLKGASLKYFNDLLLGYDIPTRYTKIIQRVTKLILEKENE